MEVYCNDRNVLLNIYWIINDIVMQLDCLFNALYDDLKEIYLINKSAFLDRAKQSSYAPLSLAQLFCDVAHNSNNFKTL